MKRYHAELVVDAKSSLGEGPIWDAQRNRILWIDYDKALLHAYEPQNGTHSVITLPHQVSCFALREAGGFIVAGNEGIAFLDPETGEAETLVDPERDLVATHFNDGKCDPRGRFLAGTLSERNEPEGSLYQVDSNRECRRLETGIACSNGLAWSIDERTLYYVDSLTQLIVAYDYDIDTGAIGNRREIVSYLGTDALPDGMTSDEEGMLWVAEWGGWQVSRWNPATGERLAVVEVPAKHVTSCAFGGEHLDELFITTAAAELSCKERENQPLAGGLFRAKVGVKGSPAHLFKG